MPLLAAAAAGVQVGAAIVASRFVNPVTAALLGAWLLREPLTPWAGAALALIAGGLWLASRPGPPTQR